MGDGDDDGDGDGDKGGGGGGGSDDPEKDKDEDKDKDKDKDKNEDEDDDDDKNEEKKNNDDTVTSIMRNVVRFDSHRNQEIARQMNMALQTKDNENLDLRATLESVIKSKDEEIKKQTENYSQLGAGHKVQLKRKAEDLERMVEELNEANNNYDEATMETKRLKSTNKDQEILIDQLREQMGSMQRYHTDEAERLVLEH